MHPYIKVGENELSVSDVRLALTAHPTGGGHANLDAFPFPDHGSLKVEGTLVAEVEGTIKVRRCKLTSS